MKQTEKKVQTFLNPVDLLAQVGLDEGMNVADFGCGNGYFAIAAAKIVGSNGQVYALDILEHMLSQTASQAKLEDAYNVTTIYCDLEKTGSTEIEDQSCDLVIVSNFLHQVNSKDGILREAYRILKTGGQILTIEWEATSALGPPRSERVPRADMEKLLEKYGFTPVKDLRAGSFHYALLYKK